MRTVIEDRGAGAIQTDQLGVPRCVSVTLVKYPRQPTTFQIPVFIADGTLVPTLVTHAYLTMSCAPVVSLRVQTVHQLVPSGLCEFSFLRSKNER